MAHAEFTSGADSYLGHLTTEVEQRSASHRVQALDLETLVGQRVTGGYSLIADIEGAEWSFLVGVDRGLDRCCRLIIELHDSVHATVEQMASAIVDRHGFKVIARRGVVLACLR